MAPLASASRCALLCVDMQPSFLAPIVGADHVLRRCAFVLEVARRLEVPVLASEQVPDRMGGTHADLTPLLPRIYAKSRFSCAQEPEHLAWLESHGRNQIVLVGIESPICVMQTALEMLGQGFEVFVAEDAVGSRSMAMQENAIARLRQAGAWAIHSESLAYEWLESSKHPEFRSVLSLVKSYGTPNHE